MDELDGRPGQMLGRPHIALLMVKMRVSRVCAASIRRVPVRDGMLLRRERHETSLFEAIERINLARGYKGFVASFDVK